MDLSTVANALANEHRVDVLHLLLSEPKTVTETHDQFVEKYDEEKHRETIYRYLETLVDAGLVEKEYRSNRGLVYSVQHHCLVLDLENWDVEPVNDE